MKNVFGLFCSIFIVIVLFGCAKQDSAPVPNDSIKLQINFYCYSFDAEPTLDCTKTENDMRVVLVEINKVWKQADIEWIFGSFNKKSINSQQFDLTGKETTQQIKSLLGNIAPSNAPGQHVWNIVFVRNMPPPVQGAAGLYWAPVQTVYFGETKITKKGTIETQPFVLAHELGHSLTLAHSNLPTNLMGPGAISADLPILTDDQIERARSQALKGPANRDDMPSTSPNDPVIE